MDVLPALSATTLDIIGLAGFDYEFNSLSRPADDPSELSEAFEKTHLATNQITPMQVLAYFIPVLRKIVSVICDITQRIWMLINGTAYRA
jgi:hypothetical protein